MLQEILKHINSSLTLPTIKRDGLILSLFLLVLSLILIFFNRPGPSLLLATASLAIIFLRHFYPSLLKSLLRVIFFFSLIISYLTSRLLLIFTFYLVLTPIALISKAIGRHFLDLKIDPSRQSYWETKNNASNYEKQY